MTRPKAVDERYALRVDDPLRALSACIAALVELVALVESDAIAAERAAVDARTRVELARQLLAIAKLIRHAAGERESS